MPYRRAGQRQNRAKDGPPTVGGTPALLLGGGLSDLAFVVLPVSARRCTL